MLHKGWYWWIVLWLIWRDLWRQLLHKVAFYHRCFRPAAVDSLIGVSQGKQETEWMQVEVLAFVWFLLFYFFFSFFPKDSLSDNVSMIPLCMPNYSVIWWGFVIPFGVAKSEFNVSRCYFSFPFFFLSLGLLWQCLLDFWLKKLNFESISSHASFS